MEKTTCIITVSAQLHKHCVIKMTEDHSYASLKQEAGKPDFELNFTR